MITSKKTDGTYGEIGFIKVKQEDGSYKDIEHQYDNKGNLIFEKGFTRSKEGVLPLVINGIGKPLKDYDIEGNISQATTPTVDSPQEVKGVGEYDEITGKYKISVVSRGKNLWYLQSSYSFTTYYDINVNINAGHYLSYIIETNGTTDVYGGTGCQLTFSDNTTQYVLFNATYRKSILLSKDVKIVRVYAGKDYNTSVGFTATVSEIMVSANADDSYEPYTPPITTPICIDSPLYKIGDYSDSISMTEEVRAIKELVLTGEESWQLHTNDTTIYQFYTNLPTDKISTSGLSAYSNIVEYGATANNRHEHKFGCYPVINGTQIAFQMQGVKEQFADISAWKSYLAAQHANGTPVTIYYVLAEPEVTEVEPVDIPTLNGTTVIDVDTEVKPSNMWVEYKSSTSEYNPVALRTTDNQALYTADNEILQTRR